MTLIITITMKRILRVMKRALVTFQKFVVSIEYSKVKEGSAREKSFTSILSLDLSMYSIIS